MALRRSAEGVEVVGVGVSSDLARAAAAIPRAGEAEMDDDGVNMPVPLLRTAGPLAVVVGRPEPAASCCFFASFNTDWSTVNWIAWAAGLVLR